MVYSYVRKTSVKLSNKRLFNRCYIVPSRIILHPAPPPPQQTHTHAHAIQISKKYCPLFCKQYPIAISTQYHQPVENPGWHQAPKFGFSPKTMLTHTHTPMSRSNTQLSGFFHCRFTSVTTKTVVIAEFLRNIVTQSRNRSQTCQTGSEPPFWTLLGRGVAHAKLKKEK